MSPKAKKIEKAEKKIEKTSAKAPAKAGAPANSKSTKSAKADIALEAAPAEPSVDLEELEEQQAEAAAASGGGNAAALAAANSTTEMSASFKNFRHHPDMENFYRFIHDNDLRHEALAIIDEIMVEKHNRRALKTAKAQAH